MESGTMATYTVYRKFFNDDVDTVTVETGLTLEEARAHCNDPETSSRTCKDPENVARTEEYGPWFDCYVED
jgi:hypothetical protein